MDAETEKAFDFSLVMTEDELRRLKLKLLNQAGLATTLANEMDGLLHRKARHERSTKQKETTLKV